MIKKTITYTDYNGTEQTEDFYFNMTKAEIVEMEWSGKNGSFTDYIERIIKAEKGGEIIKAFREFISLGYGQRSEDGKRFVKTPEILQDFIGTEAYSVLFMELVTDEKASTEFVNGMLPSDLDVDEALKARAEKETEEAESDAPKLPKDMSREELMQAFMEKNKGQLGQGNLK